MMKSMTSDLWYVGKVLAKEHKRKKGGVGQKSIERKKEIFVCKKSEVHVSLLFTS